MTDHKLSKDPSRLIHYQDVEIPEFDPGVYQSDAAKAVVVGSDGVPRLAEEVRNDG